LGEFGATIIFAGSLQGVTQTAPVAIYLGLEGDRNAAFAIAAVLIAASALVLLSVKLLVRGGTRRFGLV
jgi:molybdate transport system permease protein